MAVTIRKATPGDESFILNCIKDLAAYEKMAHYVINTPELIHKEFFAPNSIVNCLIAETHSQAVGFAVYYFTYSTFTGKRGLHLEDLFVCKKARGAGAGKALFEELIGIANSTNSCKMQWVVLDWNTPAIDFYERYGATTSTEWLGYRLNQEQLEKFK